MSLNVTWDKAKKQSNPYKKICSAGIRMPKPLLNEIEKKIETNIAEDNIIKGIRNLFRLKKKKDNGIKDKIIRGIRTLFEWNKEHYFETVRISNGFDGRIINISYICVT